MCVGFFICEWGKTIWLLRLRASRITVTVDRPQRQRHADKRYPYKRYPPALINHLNALASQTLRTLRTLCIVAEMVAATAIGRLSPRYWLYSIGV